MATLARMHVELVARGERYRREMNRATTATRTLRTAIGGLRTAALVLAGGTGIGLATKKVIAFGTAVEETGSKFATVFGGSSGEMTRFIEQFGTTAGLSSVEAQELTASIGGLAQAFGFAVEDSAAFAQETTRIAADLASFHNAAGGAEEVLNALKSAFVGEFEPMKRFDIVLRQADVNLRALAMTGKENAKQLTQQERALATMALVTENAGVAMGDLARTQESSANRARRLGAQFRDIRDAIAKALLPVFDVFMQNIEQMLGGTATFLDWLKTSAPIMTAWAEVGVAAFKVVASWLSAIVNAAFEVGRQLVNVSRALLALATGDMRAFHEASDRIVETWKDIGDGFLAAGDDTVALYRRVEEALVTFGETTVSIVAPALGEMESAGEAAEAAMSRLNDQLERFNKLSALISGLSRVPGLGFLGGVSSFLGIGLGIANPAIGLFGDPIGGKAAQAAGKATAGVAGASVVVNVPPAADPMTLARDAQWQRALAQSFRVLQGNGLTV